MRKTLLAGLLLLACGLASAGWAAPPPDPGDTPEAGLGGTVTVQAPVRLKLIVRGQQLSLPAYSTSLGDEFMVAAESPELARIASSFGAQLEWKGTDGQLLCNSKGQQRWLKSGQRKVEGGKAQAGAQEAELPIEAQQLGGRLHVPLSVLEHFLDARMTVRPQQVVYFEPVIRSVRIEGSGRKPKLIVESSAPVNFKAFQLKGPDRYVIDIPGAVFDTPEMTVVHPELGTLRLGQFELGPAISRIVVPIEPGVQIRPEGGGLGEALSWQLEIPKGLAQTPDKMDVQEVRLEKSDKGQRLIVTANEPIQYEWQRMGDGDPRWWLDIPQAVLRSGKQDLSLEGKVAGTVRISQNQPDPNPVVRIVVDLPQALEITTSAGDSPNQLVIEILDKELDLASAVSKGKGSTEQAALTGSGLIVIDAGHGGSDPGAINKQLKLTEAEVTLDISQRLAKILKAQGWNVVMTRTNDVDVSYKGSSAKEELGARVKVANEAKADLFLSIHCNASVSPKSAGTSLHYYKKSDYVLASQLHQAVLSATGRSDRGVVANRFYVLAHSTMPAVLVETAFLTNPTEGALLGDPGYRQKIAEGLAQGLRQYAARKLNLGTAKK